MKTKRNTATQTTPHPFFADRGIREGYLVVNAARWESLPGSRGGFKPTTPPDYRFVGDNAGYLWPTIEAAEGVARAMIEKLPGRKYVLFRIVAIVETSPPPVTVTRV
jgi:hypothetical protein